MLWTISIVLIVLWLLGLISGVGGQFIHLLLLVAGAVLIFNLISNRRSAF
jgi:predicted membrane metal-binding protein